MTKAADAVTRGRGRFDPDALALGRFDYTPWQILGMAWKRVLFRPSVFIDSRLSWIS